MNATASAANLMLDHCEYMFSTDENFSNFGAGTPNLTDQWAINAWGLQPHSAGGLWAMKHVTSTYDIIAEQAAQGSGAMESVFEAIVKTARFSRRTSDP